MQMDLKSERRGYLKFALIGYPLGHSLSAFIHEKLFEYHHVAASYRLYETQNLAETVAEAKKLNGFNVTIPYKQKILAYLDEIDPAARAYGAVNTVVTGDRMTGYNTDAAGFNRALKRAGIPLGGRTLLLGAGGVARVIALEALRAGSTLTVAVPTKKKAEQLVDSFSELFPTAGMAACSNAEISGKFDLVINASPVGMFPETERCPVDQALLQTIPYAFDAVYNPRETRFLSYVRAAGGWGENGLSMLVLQAVAAQEIWLGESFTEKEVETLIAETGKQLA